MSRQGRREFQVKERIGSTKVEPRSVGLSNTEVICGRLANDNFRGESGLKQIAVA